jgi:hypothetical protein
MAVSISLHSLVEELEAFMDGLCICINTRSGEVYTVTEDELATAMEEDDENLVDYHRDGVDRACQILFSGDWIRLPARHSSEEHRLMEDFILSRVESRYQEELLQSIRGRGAFRRYKETLMRHGIQDAWYRFRKEELARWAKELLKEHGFNWTP